MKHTFSTNDMFTTLNSESQIPCEFISFFLKFVASGIRKFIRFPDGSTDNREAEISGDSSPANSV